MQVETPMHFMLEKRHRDFLVKYENAHEIGQGGPVTGDLSINGIRLAGKFGGPVLFDSNRAFLPFYKRTSLRLAMIDLPTLKITILSDKYSLIHILSISEDHVRMVVDLSKMTEIIVPVPRPV